MIGFLGGLFELFEISFGLILGFISSYYFKKEIINELKKGRKEYEKLLVQFEKLKKSNLNLIEERKFKTNEDNKQMREDQKEEEESKFEINSKQPPLKAVNSNVEMISSKQIIIFPQIL